MIAEEPIHNSNPALQPFGRDADRGGFMREDFSAADTLDKIFDRVRRLGHMGKLKDEAGKSLGGEAVVRRVADFFEAVHAVCEVDPQSDEIDERSAEARTLFKNIPSDFGLREALMRVLQAENKGNPNWIAVVAAVQQDLPSNTLSPESPS